MLILASNSAIRSMLLKQAGVSFQTKSPDFNEDTAKRHHHDASPENIALHLAKGKALSVSAANPTSYVIGSDQLLECEGHVYSKPASVAQAKQHLQSLRGKPHRLHTSVALAHQNSITWSHTESAILNMRTFSDKFLDFYVESTGSDVLGSVGAYKFEGLGIQLFESAHGSFHGILGLPLLPLLQELRKHGLIET